MTVSPTPAPTPWTIARVLRWAADDFAKRGNPCPRLDAEVLLSSAVGVDRIRLVIEAERELADAELAAYRELIRRRRTGEPVAYILGHREFHGLDLVVDQRALVPRPDTETLVTVALERTQSRSMFGRALDLCTGTGCVAIAFAKVRPTWRVVASDVSEDAASLAWSNTLRHGLGFSLRVTIGDLFSAVAGERFELVTANPPYIPSAEIAGLMPDVRDFEPRLALDGGSDGLDFVRAVVRDAPAFLVPGGVLAVEVGFEQADRVARLFEQSGFAEIEKRRDYGGHERVVSGCLSSA